MSDLRRIFSDYGFYVLVVPGIAALLVLLAALFPGKLSLVFKQMRQRALGTALTLLLVMLGVALAVSVFLVLRESGKLFGQSDFGYDVLVGKAGSPLQLTLNTVYHLDVSPGNIPLSACAELLGPQCRPLVKAAVPYAVGDTYQGRYPIVGTLPKLFGYDDAGNLLPEESRIGYRQGHFYGIDGQCFAPDRFQAVIGSEVARREGLRIGSTFQATHGSPKPNETPDIHAEVWTVVGVMKETHTANDRVLFIPLLTFYTIAEHGTGLIEQERLREGEPPPAPEKHEEEEEKHYTVDADGRIHLTLPKNVLAISAILVKSRGGITGQRLIYKINNSTQKLQAVNPAAVMREFFDTFLKSGTTLLIVVAALVSLEAAVSILVSIYNSVAARRREIAILRALGATRRTVVGLICLEAGLIGLFGGIAGVLVGHLVGAVGSVYFERVVGEGIDWVAVGSEEMIYLGAVVLIAVLAGLAPGLKAYRTPVATNLVAG